MKPAKDDEAPLSQEDEVKRAADVREWLETRIAELEAETSKLRDMLALVDGILRKSSFVPATELRSSLSKNETPRISKDSGSSAHKKPGQSVVPEKKIQTENVPENSDHTRQLRRSKDGMLLANAFITSEKISIVPTSDVKLTQVTPPFQSFFVNRILKGFESKDNELAKSGGIESDRTLSYEIDESDGVISKIIIKNYREKSRLNEILNTVSWAFSRMLEKK